MFTPSQECWNQQNQSPAISHSQQNSHFGLSRQQGPSGYSMKYQSNNQGFSPSQRMPTAGSLARHWGGSARGYSPYSASDGNRMQFGYYDRLRNQPGQYIRREPPQGIPHSESQSIYKMQDPGHIPFQQPKVSGMTGSNLVPQDEQTSGFGPRLVTDQSPCRLPHHGINYNHVPPPSMSHHQFPYHGQATPQSSARAHPFRSQTALQLSAHHHYMPRSNYLPTGRFEYRAPINNSSGMIPGGVCEGGFQGSNDLAAIRPSTRLQNAPEGNKLPVANDTPIATPLPVSLKNPSQPPSATLNSAVSDDSYLDSLLNDPIGSTGSFMQQLEDLEPDSGSIASVRPEQTMGGSQLSDISSPNEKQPFAASLMQRSVAPDSQRRAQSKGVVLSHISQSCFDQTKETRSSGKFIRHFPQAGHSPHRFGIDAGKRADPNVGAYPQIHQNVSYSSLANRVDIQNSTTQYPQASVPGIGPDLYLRQNQRMPSAGKPIQLVGSDKDLSTYPYSGASACSAIPSSVQGPSGNLNLLSKAYTHPPADSQILHSSPYIAEQQNSVSSLTEIPRSTPQDTSLASIPAVPIPSEPPLLRIDCQTKSSTELNGEIISTMDQKPLSSAHTLIPANIPGDKLMSVDSAPNDVHKSDMKPSVPLKEDSTTTATFESFSDLTGASKPVGAINDMDASAKVDIAMCNQAMSSKNDLQIRKVPCENNKLVKPTTTQMPEKLETDLGTSPSTSHSTEHVDCHSTALEKQKVPVSVDAKHTLHANQVGSVHVSKLANERRTEAVPQREAGLSILKHQIAQAASEPHIHSQISWHSTPIDVPFVKAVAGVHQPQIASRQAGPNIQLQQQYPDTTKNGTCYLDPAYMAQQNYSTPFGNQRPQHVSCQQHDCVSKPPGAEALRIPGHFQVPQPRSMCPHPYHPDHSTPAGWHASARGLHPPSEKKQIFDLESVKSDEVCKATGKEGLGRFKRGKTANSKEVKENHLSPESTESPAECGGKPALATFERKRKKPPATLKFKKKRKKKTEDLEDFGGTLPQVEFDKLEKRRSARNVKRKQYSENIELPLSDEISECEKEPSDTIEEQRPDPLQMLNGHMVVEKILDIRIRKSSQGTVIEAEKKTEVESSDIEDLPQSQNYMTVKACSHEDNSHGERVEKIEESQEKKDNVMPDMSLFDKDNRSKNVGKPEEVEEYLVKYKNYSYLHCEWKTKEELSDSRVDGKIKRYKSKLAAMPEYLKADLSEPFNPDYVEVERILDVMVNTSGESEDATERNFLVKWCSLPYEESSWEQESDIPKHKILEFEERCNYRPPSFTPVIPNRGTFRKLTHHDAAFLNGNQLRDYQLEGVNWLLFNWYNERNCILADEMGLGKTVQSIAFLQKVFDHGIEGPFLVVAPLSTICNWQREFSCWTKMNAVVYHGSQTSRDMIKTYEFFCRDENLDEMPQKYKMHAVITTYEMVVLEGSHLKDIEWKCSIIDEAHRLKNQSCKLAEYLRSMHLDFKVLLTGTPLQNNIEELFALLNFLQPETFSSTEALNLEFGNMKDNTQVEKLQEVLKPIMLRRLKEDVEKSLAPKEETIIEVELTAIQKKYYRAIMEKNFEFLSKGAVSGNVPNLMNTMMELRKCCNHPYLIKGAEDKIHLEQSVESSLQLMIQSSGKLVLIDKLLPKLKSGGHKVLIFSQMVRCLDILEDYLVQSKYSYERIDGGIRGSERQAAIDRFSRPNSDRFIFLLCTRAGGLGINLTAADTVIIFDSDWNPQNDLQAQARCHRIGQKKAVKIYRLITRNSYEREMFDKASLKLGLDRAVLQSISGRQDNINMQPALSKQEVENLLKLGAYGAIMDEDDDSKKFCEENIDQILLRRTQTITIAPGQKGSTFSKASFVNEEEGSEISLNDPDFWEKWAKKADISLNLLKNNKLIIEEPRRRKQTRRFGGMTQDVEVLAEIGSESDSDYDEKPRSRMKKSRPRMKNWTKKDYFRVEKNLLAFGWGRWEHMLSTCGSSSHITVKELETLCRAMLMHCLKCYNGDEKIKAFTWNLITPTHSSAGSSASTTTGISPSQCDGKAWQDQRDSGWIKEIDVNSILQDEGFKKHLQHHCNKILLRIRMLDFIKSEILGTLTEDINEMDVKAFKLDFPKLMPSNTLSGWDLECDKNLLFGIYKHGYGRYSLIRADPKLCFKRKYGMPEGKTFAEEMDDLVEDDKEDPEYKPTRLNFSEFSEFEDSPASNTPGTAPSSPSSSLDFSTEARKDGKEKEIKSKNSESTESKETTEISGTDKKDCQQESDEKLEYITEAEDTKPTWPIPSELNLRVRKIVACYQKQHKQMRSRLMNVDQSLQKYKSRESSRERVNWTRREESDFYRTISTFGVECTGKGFSWARFRQLAKLDKKSDKNLDNYYLAFKAMCEEACGQRIRTLEDTSIVPVTKVTEERASRTLYRIELLNRIRLDVLSHQKVDERMEKCEGSADLPPWWKPGHHDKELLLGMDRHGLTRTEVHILNDPTLSFSKSILEYERNVWEKILRDLVPRAVEKNEKGEKPNSKEFESQEIWEKMQKEADSLFASKIAHAQKWPKDRILIQRAEHVCYCVIHGKWPLSRVQDDSIYVKTQLAAHRLSPDATNQLKNVAADEPKPCLTPKGDVSSRILSLFTAQSDFKDGNEVKAEKSTRDATQVQEPSTRNVRENTDALKVMPSSDSLHNLCVTSSKFNETLQSFLSSDTGALSFSHPEIGPWQKFIEEVMPSASPVAKSGITSQSGLIEQKNVLKKGVIKKKIQKSKTGFISPAVLPPDSRIPVYNPSEKKKFVGADAPLNKDLADWLKQHPGFVVDYKSLRQQLSKKTQTTADSYSSTPASPRTSSVEAKSASDQFKTSEDSGSLHEHSRSSDKAAVSKPTSKQEGLSDKEFMYLLNSYHQMNSFNQSLINPSAALLNSLYGTSQGMASLLTAGIYGGNLPCFSGDAKNDSSFQHSSSTNTPQEHSKNLGQPANAASREFHDLMSVLGQGNLQMPMSVNALAAAMDAYPQSVRRDLEKQLKQLLQQTPAQLDAKAFSGLGTPFFPGLSGGINPFMHGLFDSPEVPTVPDLFHLPQPTAFLENKYAGFKANNNLNALQNLLAAQSSLIMNMGFDSGNFDFQKLFQTQDTQQQPLASLGKSSSKNQTVDFDDSLRAVYQQLHASSMQKDLYRKKEDLNRKRSPSKEDTPIDLRRKGVTSKTSEKCD